VMDEGWKDKLLMPILFVFDVTERFPLSSSRHHLSHDDCLEDKRENYQNCSVLCCVQHLCTVICTTHEQFFKVNVGLSLYLVFVYFLGLAFCVFVSSLI